jgi:hypothetical protein
LIFIVASSASLHDDEEATAGGGGLGELGLELVHEVDVLLLGVVLRGACAGDTERFIYLYFI